MCVGVLSGCAVRGGGGFLVQMVGGSGWRWVVGQVGSSDSAAIEVEMV